MSETLHRSRKALTESGLGDHVALSGTQYPGTELCDAQHLRWKYLDDPAGPAIADEVWIGEKLIGRIVYQPRTLVGRDGELSGLYLVDLLVDPDHRGGKALMSLATAMRRPPDADLVFLTPNDTSTPLYESLLKYDKRGILRLDAMPIRPDRLAASMAPTWMSPVIKLASMMWRLMLRAVCSVVSAIAPARPDTPTVEELDRLWSEHSSGSQPIGRHDGTFHRWRYTECPTRSYQVHTVRRRGTLTGCVVHRSAVVEDLQATLILDLQATDRRSRLRLIVACVASALADRSDAVVSLTFGSHPSIGSRGIPLVRVPPKFAPQAMPMFVANAGAPSPACVLADLDVF